MASAMRAASSRSSRATAAWTAPTRLSRSDSNQSAGDSDAASTAASSSDPPGRRTPDSAGVQPGVGDVAEGEPLPGQLDGERVRVRDRLGVGQGLCGELCDEAVHAEARLPRRVPPGRLDEVAVDELVERSGSPTGACAATTPATTVDTVRGARPAADASADP